MGGALFGWIWARWALRTWHRPTPSALSPPQIWELAFFRPDSSRATCKSRLQKKSRPALPGLTGNPSRKETKLPSCPFLQHLSAGLQLRLQAIQNNVNHHSLRTLPGSTQSSASLAALRKWLQCTQFKMAQVEIQSSEAASQFYPL